MRSSDIEMLKNFKKALNLKNRIGTTRNGKIISYRVQFGSVQFYNWLLKIGLTPRKSLTIGPINIPNRYFRDFLRGHLDGDGSIRTFTDYYNTPKNPRYIYIRLITKFISASENHMLWLKEKIETVLDVYGRLHKTKPAKENYANIWVLKFGKKESIKLLSKLYYNKNVPSLSRKRKIAELFIKTA